MKMTRIALAIAATAVVSTPALATNGDSLIGLGAHSRAMGGTGAAMFMGSENALTNPGLLGKSQGTEFAIGGTLFKPAVKDDSTVGGATSPTSANDTNIIPEVSMSTRLSNNLTFGLGIFGSAGMGVDYQDDPKLFRAYSNLQLMKFAPTLAYNTDKFGIGFAPVLQYGALDLNYEQQLRDGTGAKIYKTSGGSYTTTASGNTPVMKTVGNGMSSDLGMGYNIGGYFNVAKNLTLGLSYQSPIDMKYKNQISVASAGFVSPSTDFKTAFGDHLEQPAEIKAGIAYGMGNYTITADAKQIAWGSAKGYKDFNWKDQNVFALGVKYAGQGYWLGAGANYGDDPIKKLNDTGSSYKNQVINMFNNVFFPGIVTNHVTFGGGYKLTKNMALDGAVVYAPEVSKSINTGFLSEQSSATATTQKTTHSQIGYTVSLRMNF